MTGTGPLGAVRERVLAELRQDVIAGRLRPGDRLVERELAERFAVSRVPVREAIRALVGEGFLTAETPRRIVVRHLARRDVDELFELREALEVHAAGLAARRAGPDDLAALEAILEEAAAATARDDAEAITDANTRFHAHILAMAGNGLLTSVMEPLDGRLRWLTRRNETWNQLLFEHRELYEALTARDADRVRRLALVHVQRNHRHTLRRLFGDDAE